MTTLKYFTLALCLTIFSTAFSQKGKDGPRTISAANTRINEFTALTANANAGNTTITVAASSLNANSRFTSALSAGDLVMVIQMQGALIKLSPVPVWAPDSTYGNIYNYQTCGNYEFAEVKSVISATQIEIDCGLNYSYSSTGRTQVVRVPRYSSLNVTGTGTLTTDAWNGTIGGVLVAEVSGNSIIDGVLTATGLGFRGGNNPLTGGSSTTLFASINPNGAEKGEGIGSDRITNITNDTLGRYCMGAPGNGGGGGQKDNCGGGGGGNSGNTGIYNGYGVIPAPGFNAIWNLEWPGRSAVVSSGGGKGGYGTSTTTAPDVNTTGPNNSAWGAGFNRVNRGGFGGRPMDYSTGKIFMGGGGGAGHMTVNASGQRQSNGAGACAGGAGGGLIFLLSYGTISGSGTIVSNGANGANAFGGTSFTYPSQGIDGAGGAGAGGTIILQCNGAISGITANALGGNGGNQVKSGTSSQEAQGPGGGGGGGYIASNGSVFTQNTNGGAAGTTNSTEFDTEFPTNGATSGNVGINGQVIAPSFSLTASANPTLCTNQSAVLTATSTNGSATILWYNAAAGGNSIASGTTYTTPVYASTGTYTVYVGSCPGIYRIPIIITVGSGASFAINSPTICSGQSAVLTVTTAASSYTWSTAGSPTTNTISVSPTSTTIYTINGGNGSCVGTQTTQVVVNTNPIVTVANATICSGNSVILTANGATNYTWSPGGQLTSTISVNPTSNTVYNITGANGSCTGITSATVFVNNAPTLSSNSQTICAGQIATFTVSGASSSYTWNPGGTVTNSYTISPASTTTVSVIGANGTCTAQITRTVTVTPNPIVAVSNQTICTGQSATLTANGATTYSWNTGPTTNTISVSPASTTIYTVIGTSSLCTNTQTASVTVATQPTVAVANASICSGNSTLLTANGASNYTWSPGGQLTNTVSVSPGSTTVYTITGATGTCTISTTATVNVTSTPTITGVANTTICPTQTVTFTAGGATSFTWQPTNFVGTTYTIAPSSNTVISVIGANGSCTSSTTASITIGTGISITVNNPTICVGQTATLTASGGATSYTWSSGPPNTNTLTVSPTTTTTYTILGTSGVCSGSNTAIVTVNSAPSVSVTSSSVCSGNSATLTASGASNYTWMPGGQLTSNITDNPPTTTIYTVTGANGTCTSTATGTISITPNPTLTANSATICAGQTATLTANGATTYTWNPGNLTGTTVTITPGISATYTISGTNGTCSSSMTTNVTVNNCNTVCSFNLGRDTAFCSPMNYAINGPSGYTSYSWTPGGATTQNITATNTGTYICNASVLSNDLVANGDFSLGNTQFSSNYIVPATPGAFGLLTDPGTYLVTTNPNLGHINFLNFGDHTTGTGNMMVCNGSAVANDIVWSETITVSPNTNYNFSAWVASVYNTSAGNEAQLQFSINGSLLGTAFSAPFTGGVWANFATNWNSGANTSAVITIVDQNFTAPGANDFAIDDIFYQQVCSYSDTIVVTEHLTPIVTASATSSVICNGASTSLTANGASTYTWTSGVTNGATFSPTTTTTYSVTGASVEGCTNTAVQTITVNSLPTISVITSGNICSGETATITANGSAITYTWSNSVTGNSQIVSPLTTTIYSVSGTDVNGCVSSESVTVGVSATPTITINSTSICAGQTTTLTATGVTTAIWNPGNLSGSSVTVAPTSNTTYSVVGDNGGCSNTQTTTVSVTPSPTITASSASLGGCAPFCTNFNDIVSASTTGIVYNFGDGNTANTNDPNHCYSTGGNYTVTATVTNSVLGCSSTFTLPVINVINNVIANFNITEGNVVPVGTLVNFVNASSNADSYLWNISCNGASLISQNFSATFVDTGNCCINLIASNIAGCNDTITKCINVVKEAVVIIPNVFTPNGDTKNDVFKINSSGLKSLHCVIFDRWGLKMHEWDGLNGFWDGSAQSGNAPDGTYFYIVDYTDQLDKSTTQKGFLNLFQN